MKAPTREKVNEYIACDATCPWCEGDNIHTDVLQTDASVAWSNSTCNDCDAEWTNEYRLVAIGWIGDDDERVWSDEYYKNKKRGSKEIIVDHCGECELEGKYLGHCGECEFYKEPKKGGPNENYRKES